MRDKAFRIEQHRKKAKKRSKNWKQINSKRAREDRKVDDSDY